MTSTPDIERVARAIADEGDVAFERAPDWYRKLARAAILAYLDCIRPAGESDEDDTITNIVMRQEIDKLKAELEAT